jgi:hypothetical protein
MVLFGLLRHRDPVSGRLSAVRASSFPFLGVLLLLACGRGAGGDPFATGGAGGGGGEGGVADGGSDDGGAPPLAGGEPCVDDAGCIDTIECTADSCDLEAGRCRHEPDDALCDDGVHCNGREVCSAMLGCQRGPAVTCSDDYTCTIDTCIEATQGCRHELRDADGDGDPPKSCTGGDCDDFDPLVSSQASERCGNDDDDDCDGEVDEDDCVMPLYDRCGDALEIEAPGSYALSTAAAAQDYAITCAEAAEDRAFRELVVGVTVPGDSPVDLDLTAILPRDSPRLLPGALVLAATDQCGKAAGETACVPAIVTTGGDAIARLVLRGAEPGPHAFYVAADREAELELHVDFREPLPAPENETCGTSATLIPGMPVTELLAGITQDLDSACPEKVGELVYHFDLSEPSDVRLQSLALDDYGEPVVSLRNASCNSDESEITCRAASPTELYARALDAGRYTVALSGTGPAEVELVLSISPATEPPPTEGCSEPPPIEPGVTAQVALSDATDAVQIGCLVGAPDATFALELEERSDVMLLQSGSDGDRGGVLIATDPCDGPDHRVICQGSEQWPVRAVAHGLEPGSIRAVVETARGNPTTLTALTRPAQSSVFVQFADECEDAFELPATGGRFEGNTGNQYADYDASCDYGGAPPGGAPEQMLKLTLDEPRRVVLDSSFSNYVTMLAVRKADACPGEQIAGGCVITYNVSGADEPSYAFIDTVLEAGSYFIQIDGYNGDKGRWVLEVFTREVSME